MIEARITIDASLSLIAAIDRLAAAFAPRPQLSGEQIEKLQAEWKQHAGHLFVGTGDYTPPSPTSMVLEIIGSNTGVAAAQECVRPQEGEGRDSLEQTDIGGVSTQHQSALPQSADKLPVSAAPTPAVSTVHSRKGLPWESWEDEMIRSATGQGALAGLEPKLSRAKTAIWARAKVLREVLPETVQLPPPPRQKAPVIVVAPPVVQVKAEPQLPPVAQQAAAKPAITRPAFNPFVVSPKLAPAKAVAATLPPPSAVPKFANAPAANGKVYASFAEIKAWAGHFRLHFDGGNVDAVNSLRRQFKQPELVMKS